jgi:hypothetical protein
MVKVRPAEIEAHLDGLRKAVAHSERLYRQGIFTLDELEGARTFALRERFGPLMSTEEHIAARESGDFERYEALLNDSRTPSAAAGEQAMRKAAAHYIAEQAFAHQPKSEAEQKAIMAASRQKMGEYIDMSGADADDDFAVFETKAKLDLGDKVTKPVEEPSWSKPVQHISDDDADCKSFRLRNENTPGTKRYNEAYGGDGVKRAADGRIIAKSTLREDAAKPKPLKSEYDDTRGFTVDKEYGVRSAEEASEIERFETDRHNDAVAAVEANPPTYVETGPVTLPNPGEA